MWFFSSSSSTSVFAAVTNSPTLARYLPPETTIAKTSIVSLLTVIPTSGITTIAHPPPTLNLDTHPLTTSTGPIITEMLDEIGDDIEISIDHEPDKRLINRNSSISPDKTTQLQRQFSFGSKSTDSPSLPKRNQPITSSAPSTLVKKNLEEKEVYV